MFNLVVNTTYLTSNGVYVARNTRVQLIIFILGKAKNRRSQDNGKAQIDPHILICITNVRGHHLFYNTLKKLITRKKPTGT